MGEARTFLDIFREIAEKYPSKTAITDQDGTRCTTYAQLDDISSRICGAVMEKGITKGDLVPICMSRCTEYIAAEIGVLKAGAAFIALSPEYPQARIDYISKDCGAKMIIDDDFIRSAVLHKPAEAVSVNLDDRAFLIYTSGSTGNPKGIVHTHKSMAASVVRHADTFDSTDKDIHLCCGPFSFIVMMVDIFTGSERVLRITGNGYRFMNLFGCSETAGVAVMFEVDKSYDNTPIGKAANGIRAFLLCDDGHIGTFGEEGELCIVGDIACEYFGMPEQTAKAFEKLDDGNICFHTNDICRMLPDGNLVYVDRKDWMVKVNGQRVELGEVEAAFSSIEGITAVAVKGFVNSHGQTYMCAFYTADQDFDVETLKELLSCKLPEYMIPSHLVQIEKMPINANGKIDRKSLKAPEENTIKREYKAPKNAKETAICSAYEKILEISPVGADDDFFAVGGDSIQAMLLSSELDGLTIENIYKYKTPSKLAEVWNGNIRQERNAADDPKFRNQFDESGRLRTQVSMRFYRKTQAPRIVLRFDEEIDADALQYAAEKALSRFKSFSFKVVKDESRYYCALNHEKPVIHHNGKGRGTVGGKDNNGYLTRIGYSDNEITVDMFHGTNDGVGSMKFLQTLTYYYCSKKYGITSEGIHGLILADTEEDPREYADSTLFLPDEQVAPAGKYEYERAYTVTDELIEENGKCAYYHFNVDCENADRYISRNNTSTSALFTYMLSRVIAERNDLKGLPIVSAMAVDARPSYQAEPTMQCCVSTLSIPYDENTASLSCA